MFFFYRNNGEECMQNLLYQNPPDSLIMNVVGHDFELGFTKFKNTYKFSHKDPANSSSTHLFAIRARQKLLWGRGFIKT